MIVEPDFLDHWKTRLLARLLGTELAPVYVLRLWAHCQQRKTDRFTGWNPDVLASVCRWDGDGKKLWDAMLQTFLEQDGDDVIAHDWGESNAGLISAWTNGKKGGRPRKPEPDKPSGNRPVIPAGTDRQTDRVDREDGVDRVDQNKGGGAPSPWLLDHGIELPEQLRTDECIAMAREWLAYKREMRKGYKPVGLRNAAASWAKEFTADTFPAAVRRSMANTWQGIFQNDNTNRRPGSAGHGGLTPAERRNSTLDPRDVAAVRANAEASAERDRLRLEADPDYNPFYS